MAKSYFTVLGLESGASAEEIRAAYCRLAKEYHPDHFKGGNEPFLEIQEAYSALTDPRGRNAYERTQSEPGGPTYRRPRSHSVPEPLIPERKPVDLGAISLCRSFDTFDPSFDEVFDWLWRNFPVPAPSRGLGVERKSGRLERLTLEIPVSMEHAMDGGTARILVPARAVCPFCRGRGEIGPYQCSRCAGEGEISGDIPVVVPFPPGLQGDHAVVVPLERFGIKNLRLTVLFRLTEDTRY